MTREKEREERKNEREIFQFKVLQASWMGLTSESQGTDLRYLKISHNYCKEDSGQHEHAH